jgi:hypothetical protein
MRGENNSCSQRLVLGKTFITSKVWSGRRESNPRCQLGKSQFDVENIEIFAFLATFWHQGSHVELCENKLFRHSHVSTAC